MIRNLEKMIMENSRDMIWVIDGNRKPVFISPSVENIRGFTTQEALSQSLEQSVEKDSLKLLERIIREKKEAYLEGVREGGLEEWKIDMTAEAGLIHRDGHIVPTETNISINLDRKGNVKTIFGITRDISDRRKAEKAVFRIYDRFIKIIEKTPFGIFLFSGEGDIIFYNTPFRELLGYSAEHLYNKSIYDLTASEDMAHTGSFLRKMNAGASESSFFRKRYIRKDGSHLWVSENYILFDDEGERKIYLGLCEDINERVRLEHLSGQADKVNSLGQLTGSVAHDLNNMLQVIIGFSDLLAQMSVSEYSASYITKIRSAADRSLSIIRQLLVFARGREEKTEELSLDEIVRSFMELLLPMIGRGIKVEYHPAEGPSSICADRGQVEQILMNLCLNSRDAVMQKRNYSQIEISVNRSDLAKPLKTRLGTIPEGRYVCLDVKDNGTGIPPEYLTKIFEPFFTTKKEGRGTGLGLSTVRELAEKNNAFLDLSSLEMIGTRITVYFPWCDESKDIGCFVKRAPCPEKADELKGTGTDVKPAQPAFLPVFASGTDVFSSRRGTALLADDDEAVLGYTESVLGKMGFNVIKAVNGLEAVELYLRNQNLIDLMIFDLVMPELGGQDTYHRILDIDPLAAGKKIIFITGSGASGYQNNDSPDIVSGGISGKGRRTETDNAVILGKPFTECELASAVKSFFIK